MNDMSSMPSVESAEQVAVALAGSDRRPAPDKRTRETNVSRLKSKAAEIFGNYHAKVSVDDLAKKYRVSTSSIYILMNDFREEVKARKAEGFGVKSFSDPVEETAQESAEPAGELVARGDLDAALELLRGCEAKIIALEEKGLADSQRLLKIERYLTARSAAVAFEAFSI